METISVKEAKKLLTQLGFFWCNGIDLLNIADKTSGIVETAALTIYRSIN